MEKLRSLRGLVARSVPTVSSPILRLQKVETDFPGKLKGISSKSAQTFALQLWCSEERNA